MGLYFSPGLTLPWLGQQIPFGTILFVWRLCPLGGFLKSKLNEMLDPNLSEPDFSFWEKSSPGCFLLGEILAQICPFRRIPCTDFSF